MCMPFFYSSLSSFSALFVYSCICFLLCSIILRYISFRGVVRHFGHIVSMDMGMAGLFLA